MILVKLVLVLFKVMLRLLSIVVKLVLDFTIDTENRVDVLKPVCI